ncbi:unnamed protein product [Didymodactylos carnosus]|uniref:Uncharacterized protein n=1 Tax=Didymodactylos carnosus TaxID=1234261 RepID=A0A8S2UD17_9BILA|nr:unnamed protein product [Didymodactylos carnosus]CAF4337645.1 unnamed protein product [Didymodactylos carnosus]
MVAVEGLLQLDSDEIRVFRALLEPEQYMIGYPKVNNNDEPNALNNLFKLDCKDDDELCIRHTLVNLMAMIILGGKNNFLWTFAFSPLTLQNTFGFGSTTQQIITTNGVHYDCGCVISMNGDLMRYSTKVTATSLNVPAVYPVYFSTFGAMAWHALLFADCVKNLFGPVLATHAINDNTADVRLAGQSSRTKVCHFVRARLLSTFLFLSLNSTRDDACILLNGCFEQFALSTINQAQAEHSWIKSHYRTLDEELTAESNYQTKIFFNVRTQLPNHKAYINNLLLQSQIQSKLQDFVTNTPIMIQYSHFKTELYHPRNSHLRLNILRHALDSTDFLKMTRFIYDLSQFYILLHQTYTQLIQEEQFLTISLKELYEIGQTYYKYQQQIQHNDINHLTIINNGIKAVNEYHAFANGLIKPGACDATQYFDRITLDTPISYLVTGGNYDEGDIIMRVLSLNDWDIDMHNVLPRYNCGI